MKLMKALVLLVACAVIPMAAGATEYTATTVTHFDTPWAHVYKIVFPSLDSTLVDNGVVTIDLGEESNKFFAGSSGVPTLGIVLAMEAVTTGIDSVHTSLAWGVGENSTLATYFTSHTLANQNSNLVAGTPKAVYLTAYPFRFLHIHLILVDATTKSGYVNLWLAVLKKP